MCPITRSDVSEVLSLRWDDGTHVIDPDETMFGPSGYRDNGGVGADALQWFDFPDEGLTIGGWNADGMMISQPMPRSGCHSCGALFQPATAGEVRCGSHT